MSKGAAGRRRAVSHVNPQRHAQPSPAAQAQLTAASVVGLVQ